MLSFSLVWQKDNIKNHVFLYKNEMKPMSRKPASQQNVKHGMIK